MQNLWSIHLLCDVSMFLLSELQFTFILLIPKNPKFIFISIIIFLVYYGWSFNSYGGSRSHQPPISSNTDDKFKENEEKNRRGIWVVPMLMSNIIQTEEIKWPEGRAGQQTPRCSRLSISDSALFSHSSLKLAASDNAVDYHRKVQMHFARHATDLNICFTSKHGHFIV